MREALFFWLFVLCNNMDFVICQNAGEEGPYFEGDILSIAPSLMGTKSGLVDESYRWPNGVIPYEFEDNFPQSSQAQFEKAKNHISSQTCIRFVRRTNETAFVKVVEGAGCYAEVGYMGRAQLVSLPPGCTSVGIIVHELIHSIGFFHEQSRTDRDDFVVIHLENVHPHNHHNFEKYTENIVTSFDVEYDYQSIMHYGSKTFSINGKETISTKPPGIPIGNRVAMSPKDVVKVNRMYKCEKFL